MISSHVAAAMVHPFIFRDRIMQRMLPGKPMVAGIKNPKPEVEVMKASAGSRVS
jgi:cytochrome b561